MSFTFALFRLLTLGEITLQHVTSLERNYEIFYLDSVTHFKPCMIRIINVVNFLQNLFVKEEESEVVLIRLAEKNQDFVTSF